MFRGSMLLLLLGFTFLPGCPGDAGDDDSFDTADDDTSGDDDTSEADDDDDSAAEGRVDIDWGVVTECGVPADGGFGDWYAADSGILVYGTTTYPVAGHFVDFLRDGWGVDVLKELYVAENLDLAFASQLGMTTSEVEAAWLATIE